MSSLTDFPFIISTLISYVLIFIFYSNISKGLGNKAFYLQMRRFLPCVISVTLPPSLIDTTLISQQFTVPVLIGAFWIITYPTLYFLTNKKRSVSFSYHLDIVFGLYLISFFISWQMLLQIYSFYNPITLFILTLLEFTLLLIPIFQYIYFLLYNSCISATGMMALQQTDKNEALEFLAAISNKMKFFTFCTLLGTFSLILYFNYQLSHLSYPKYFHAYAPFVLIALMLFLLFYLWGNGKRSVFYRTGIVELFLDVKEYFKEAAEYRRFHKENISALDVKTNNKAALTAPHSIIVAIGESASRDHMSLFSDYPRDTTPWLSTHQDDNRFFLFPDAYACWNQTVPVLERALTECNQYNTKKFKESFSIIDIASKAGYKTYWYSNQGRIGSADTQITLVAETADVAKWTQQDSSKKQFDTILLDYLQEVDPTKNNFIVLHLMGSHDNFQTRYPKDFTIWGTPGKYHLIDNYDNSLAFTDKILEEVYKFASEKLNLQAMVYFSDHATIPDKRRQPDFSSFATVRIPMFAYLADEYQLQNPAVPKNLRNNVSKPFTNDLIYDLLCSIMNISSSHFEESQSIASSRYSFNKETLATNLGKTPLSKDL